MCRLLLAGTLLTITLWAGAFAQASCISPKNPIEAENCLPGNPPGDWQVDSTGDPTIQGFATDISVNAGQTIGFKVKTDASQYALEIFRLGYYAGLGARKITVISPSVQLPQIQPACITDNSTYLMDCGNWGLSASWQVPSNAVSGVYLVHLVRRDTGGESQIFFIVRNDSRHSDVLYQTSDLTWQAYNNYGGHSLYGSNGFDLANRAYKVSYNRPSNTRALEAATFIFNAEYPMIRFLEANGYDVSYFTGVDAVRNSSLLINHKIYLSSGHDEYWDGTQRANVQAARDSGVNLAFFSGNEVFWKTRWESSIDGTGTPYRTLVCYKETLANAVIDPMDPPTWTGTWRDTRFSPPADGGHPENALTGTLFMVNGPGADNTDLPIKIPAADGKMRFWRNTAVANLGANQIATMPAGTLGYEWDVDADNGSRPAGIIDLSTATYNLTTDYLLDFGGLYGPGTATHHATLYRAASGALVFGSGTVQWAWGLDSNHDGDINPDPDPSMQQATVNLFADMGVQPATLIAGLQSATQSTDTQAPVSAITSPIQGAVVNSGTAVLISGTAADSGGGIVGGVEVSVDAGQTWHPAIGRETWSYSWTPNKVGTATLISRAVDDSGNLERPSGSVQVQVNPQVCPCSIWSPSTTPSLADSGDTGSIEVGVKFRADNDGLITGVRFYKATTNTGTHIAHLWTSSGMLLGTATFTNESGSGWQQVSFGNAIPITANTSYVVSYFSAGGHYSVDPSYFLGKAADNPPVHGLANGVDGPNGLYVYTSTAGVFPTNSFSGANYWVDIVYVNGSTFNVGGNLAGTGGAGATVTLSGAANAVVTSDNSGNYRFSGLLNGSYTVTPSNAGVTFNPSSQAVTLNGISLNNVNFTATVTNPLTISGTISGAGGPGAAVNLAGAAFLATTADSNGNYSFSGLLAGSYTVTPSRSGYIFNPDNRAVTLTNVNMSGVNFNSQICTCTSIWAQSVVPTLVDSGDGNSLEIGTKFRSDVAGSVLALRFYKAAANTGSHIGHLWSSNGTLLGTATFTNESAAGWQQATLSHTVALAANTTYIVSYFAPVGHYSADGNYFSSGTDNPPLHALANGADGPNGVYLYSKSPGFPTNSYNSSNYWVDVVFTPNSPHKLSGTISGPGGPGATVTLAGAGTGTTTADTSGNYTFLNVADGSYIVTPSLPGFAYTVSTQSVTVSGADLTGINFTTLSNCPCDMVWQGSTTPSVVDSKDGGAVNLGVKFRADSDGYIIGLRFYKSALNTGTHIGTLWSKTGTSLGSVTFNGESGSGWQQALFANPIAVTAKTTYVASYLAPAGHYSAANNYFASAGVDSPPLHALASGVDGPNGVYAYGSNTIFPTSTYQAGNYWVDVIFTPGSTHAISGTIAGAGGPGATVNLTGSSNAVTTADSSGNYTFSGLANGSYTITPSQSGYVFTVSNQTVTLAGANVTGVNFTTVQNCPCNTVWPLSTQPALIDSGDGGSVNLGVRFRADSDGYIIGLRFYKATLNTGTHVGALWSNSGTQLSSAIFTGESASGWQQVLFGSPVPVSANKTYVASYIAPAGHYSANSGFFASTGTDNPPLHALVDGFDGANGVYLYGKSLAFPNQTYRSANYWVDVIYAGTQTYTIAGTISGPGGPGATVKLTGAANAATTADANGNYSFGGLANGNYTVTPSNTGHVFTPVNQAVTINNSHALNVNFTSQ